MSDEIKTEALGAINESTHSSHLEAMQGKGTATPEDKQDEIKIDTKEVTMLSDEMVEECRENDIFLL